MISTTRLPLLLVVLAACQPRSDGSPSQPAWSDAIDPASGVAGDCGFVKAFAHPNGRALLNDFLARDAAGEFLQSDPWFDGATDCPTHEPGPDRYALIFSYTPSVSDKADGLMQAVMTSRRFGYVGADSARRPTFVLDTGIVIDTLTLRRTRYGWRVVSPALRQMVLYSDSGTASRLGPIADSVAALAREVAPH